MASDWRAQRRRGVLVTSLEIGGSLRQDVDRNSPFACGGM
jgi:hypothetical protein